MVCKAPGLFLGWRGWWGVGRVQSHALSIPKHTGVKDTGAAPLENYRRREHAAEWINPTASASHPRLESTEYW